MSLLEIYDDVWSIILLYLDFDDWDNIELLKNTKVRNKPTKTKLRLLKQSKYLNCTEEEAKNIVRQNGNMV